MNKRMETAGRTLRLALALLVLAFLLNAGGVSASDSSLELSDFNRGGLEVEVAALFEAGGAGSEPALYSASGSRWTESGSLVDGDVLLGEGSSIVRVMLPQSDGSLLRLNVDGPLVLRDYFGSSGGGADLTAWIQTAQGAASFAASDVRSVGSSYVNFNVPQAARSTLSGIASGDRFILALTRPAPEPDPTPTPEPTATPEPTSEPGAITGLTMTSSQPEHLWVSWDQADPEPTEYRLNWAPVDEPFPAWNSNQGGNLWLSPRTAQDFSNLVNPGVTYKLRMRAIYKTGPNAPWSGPWSEVVTQRVGNHPPGAPTDLSVDSATHDGVALSWEAPDHNGLTGYRILRASDADSLETIVEDTGNLATGYTDTTAADDATHHYAIIALSLDGDSRRSGTVSATTPPRTPDAPVIEGAPGAPSTLTAQLDGSGGVTLSWTDPDDSAITGYRILRGVDALSMRVIKENTGSASVGYTDATAAVNSTHVYAVQARNTAGLSQLSNTVSVTTLSAPTELDTSAASGRVALSWSAPDLSAITGYRVMRGTTAASLRQIAQVSGRSNTFYTDFDVLPVREYHYAVRAISAQGSSPLSETVSATTQPVTTVSRYARFDDAGQLVIQQDADTPTPVTLVSNEDRPNATFYGTGGTVEPYRADASTSNVARFGIVVPFRTGRQPGGYNLSSVRAAITNTSTDDSDSNQREAKARVRIFAEHRGSPGHVVHTLGEVTVASGASNVTTTFTAEANATLQPNTTYWALFEVTSSRSGLSTSDIIRFNIPLTRHSLEDACSVPGWSIGDDYLTANIAPLAIIFSDATSDGGRSGTLQSQVRHYRLARRRQRLREPLPRPAPGDNHHRHPADWRLSHRQPVPQQPGPHGPRLVQSHAGGKRPLPVRRVPLSPGQRPRGNHHRQRPDSPHPRLHRRGGDGDDVPGAQHQRRYGRPDLFHAHRRRRLLPGSGSRRLTQPPERTARPARQLGHLHRSPARPHAPGENPQLHSGI